MKNTAFFKITSDEFISAMNFLMTFLEKSGHKCVLRKDEYSQTGPIHYDCYVVEWEV